MKNILPIVSLLLVACPPMAPDDDTGHAMDWDVDGWFGREDCDNQDPGINPSADEICDGLDNDCDGDIDEGWEDSRPWYADVDADGYGDPGARTRGCEQPDGYVADHGDCDDGDPAVHPDAPDDWYDGVDSDCEGNDDHDADDDGYSWDGSGGTDCDDDDPLVHPGRLDWSNEMDDDCDGEIDATDLTELEGLALGGFDNGLLGSALATIPDQNGDGHPDLLVGEPGVGAAWILAGPLTDTVQLPNAAIARLWGADSGGQAGAAVARAGDTDGDGVEELLVGAWLAAGGRGAVSLLPGPIVSDRQLADAPWRIEGELPDDWLGYALAGVGDTDGDGFDDLLVGARGWSVEAEGAGAAWLLRGSAHGPQTPSEGARVFGTRVRDFAGCAVAGPGDCDGDGLDDVLVGARGEDSGGMAALFLDALDSPQVLDSAEGQLRGEDPYDYAGWALAGVGDIDDDGYADLLIGAYGRDDWGGSEGETYLVLGRGREDWITITSLAHADASYTGERSGDRSGWAVAGPGDVDGDGRPDLLVSAPGGDLGQDDSGTVYLLLEPGRGGQELRDAALRLHGGAGDAAGSALSPTGDHDGDTLPDLLLGLPGQGDDNSGAIRMVGLSASGA